MRAWAKWPLVRAHLCTLAVSVSLNSTWRTPREGFRYGGLQFAVVLTVAMLVTLPLTLLHLAVGQLSQQDAVGVWKAVPFFKGVGYIRLLVSCIGCVCAVIHVALSVAYFLYTLSSSIPFPECTDYQLDENGTLFNAYNASCCLNATFMSPVSEKIEYYLAMSLITLFLWIALPFLLFSPVKAMKRVFYFLGPLLVGMGVAVASGAGIGERLSAMHDAAAWSHVQRPHVWLGAITQALLSTQVAGGYLISAGDSIYSNTNVQWTAIALVCSNLLCSWAGLLFWFLVTDGAGADTGPAAVLTQMYRAAEEQALPVVWPLLVFAALALSGVITMLTFLYPVFDRIRRSGTVRWRATGACAALAGAGLTLAALAGHQDALAVLEDTALPLLACTATVFELVAFVFIYGWKTLKEDVEFLTGREMSSWMVFGWCAAPAVVAPLLLWWVVVVVTEGRWSEPPWPASAVAATAALMLLVIGVFAVIVVAKQVQYDIIAKLKSSFQPSRHWGPRDPISHYYWLARREEAERGVAGDGPRTRYRRRQVGQLSGAASYLNMTTGSNPDKDINSNENKRRSNSDDLIYTICRRIYLEEAMGPYFDKTPRSKSLDWGKIPRVKKNSMDLKMLTNVHLSPVESVDSVSKGSVCEVKNSRC